MTTHINQFLKNIKPYQVASHKIWSIGAKERGDILKLDWNEATIPPSPKVQESILTLVQDGQFFNLYPSTNNMELLQLIADYVKLPMDNVQYFASSDSIHEYISKMYIGVGDTVVIASPAYDNFRLTVEANGGKVFYSEIGGDFKFNPQKFEKDLNQVQPDFTYICNPNNPIGYSLSVDYIESLLKKYPNIMFLIDEAYAEFSEESAKDLVLKYDNILITRTVSKAFALANFRFGYLLASKENIKSISGIRNPKNITTFAQVAAMACFSDVAYMQDYVKEVNAAKSYFINELTTYNALLKTYPSVANFVMIEAKDIQTKKSLIKHLLEENIYIRELAQSPLVERCIRITIGTKPQMERVVEVIGAWADGVKNER